MVSGDVEGSLQLNTRAETESPGSSEGGEERKLVTHLNGQS